MKGLLSRKSIRVAFLICILSLIGGLIQVNTVDAYQEYPPLTYVWHQHNPRGARIMTPSSNSVCFLTGVTGKFQGSGESVYIFEAPDGHWYLGGKSKQNDVSATAQCVYSNEKIQLKVTGEYYWHQGEKPTPMEPVKDNACFLTRISGKFMGARESVRILKSNGRWYLFGTSGQRSVQAGARCIKSGVQVSLEESWVQGETAKPLDLYPTSRCYLTMVAGKFQGGGEAVNISVDPTSNLYFLAGRSRQIGVQAGAGCIRRAKQKGDGWMDLVIFVTS